jgi:aldehyde dehydrogenase (NAD+)
VASKAQFDKVQGLIQRGVDEGATVVAGGTGRPAGLDKGYYVKPTVFANVTNGMTIAREEIFGPVLTVIPHDGDDDAVRIANDSPYGLSATVFGTDPDRAAKVAARVRAGTINVNGGVWYSADAPFGGYKQSGNGREMGLAGFEEYLETKTIATAAN